jgi:hypothetical protein
MTEVTTTVYRAEDGKEFLDKDDCARYELFNLNLEQVREEINEFFADVNNYDYVVPGHFNPHYCSRIDEHFQLTILESRSGSTLWENFQVDFNKMMRFECKLQEKYGLRPKYPAKYWGK